MVSSMKARPSLKEIEAEYKEKAIQLTSLRKQYIELSSTYPKDSEYIQQQLAELDKTCTNLKIEVLHLRKDLEQACKKKGISVMSLDFFQSQLVNSALNPQT